MKFSIFNNIFALSDGTKCIYNSASDKFVLLNTKLVEHLDDTADELKKNSPLLFDEFYTANILVDDDLDEYGLQLQKSISIKNYQEHFHLIVNPTLDCNLHCWYCYENHIKESKITDSTMSSILKFINQVCEKQTIKTFSLSFFGGEPFVEFDAVKIIINHTIECCNLYQVDLHISFTSNGVLVNRETIEYFKEKKVDVGFQITLDGGREYHNKTRFLSGSIGTYDTILKNVRILLDCQIEVVLRINYTTDNFSSLSSILYDLNDLSDEAKNCLKVDFQKVWQDKGKDLNEMEMMELFRQRGFRVSSPNVNIDNLRFPCYADYSNQILINYNGDVFKCTARDFKTDECLGYLSENGEICWKGMPPEERILNFSPKEICKTCSIFPLCGGGCIQKRSELEENVCMFDIDDKKKKDIILDRFYEYFVSNSKYNQK